MKNSSLARSEAGNQYMNEKKKKITPNHKEKLQNLTCLEPKFAPIDPRGIC